MKAIYDSLMIVGVVVVGILVFIPTIAVVRLLAGIVLGCLEERRAAARKVTISVPGLADFWTTTDEFWFGEVQGLQVMINSQQPPTESHAKQVREILNSLPLLLAQAKTYLGANEELATCGAAFKTGVDPLGRSRRRVSSAL